MTAISPSLLAANADLFTVPSDAGKIYQQTQDHVKAIADFTSAIAQSPEHVDAYFRRCLSHYRRVRYPSHRRLHQRDRAQSTRPPEFHYYRGLAHIATRAWDKAAADLTSANDRNTDNRTSSELARSTSEMDQLIHALREYTIAHPAEARMCARIKGAPRLSCALGDSAGSQEDLGKIAR